MAINGYSDELQRALARPDAETLTRQIDAFAEHVAVGNGEWPDEHAEDFGEIIASGIDDPDKALAYIAIATSRSSDPGFLASFGCGPLEDILQRPSQELLERIIAEARKSSRFRWLLSHPFKSAISKEAWEAIEKLRITGSHEEPAHDTMP